MSSVKKWILKNKQGNAMQMAVENHITEELATILINREIEKPIEYLKASLSSFHNPSLMLGLDNAVELIEKKIKEQKLIRIIGDYDVDGIASVKIAVDGLRTCGANVDYDIPDRIKDGYGLNISLIEKAIEDNIDTIITVDNGIVACDAVKYAKDNGLTVIVTDHHSVQTKTTDEGNAEYVLPDADVIVNPHQPGCSYPYKDICGAMVIFKVVTKLFKKMNRSVEELNPLIEIVAIATICDVMDLKDENRAIVKHGLSLMKDSKNLGLRTLIREYDIKTERLGSYQIGFIIGPTLNASGRLDSAMRGVELLLENNERKVEEIAKDLILLNNERKALTEEGVELANKYIQDNGIVENEVYIINLKDVHESIIGIIAGRIKEQYNHPVIVFTNVEDGILKGSGRSIEDYNMFEELNKHKDVLVKFGGHPLAAGLSIKADDFSELNARLNNNPVLSKESFIQKILIDLFLPVHIVTERLITELSYMEPFGKGNPKPVIADKNARIIGFKIVGSSDNVIKLTMLSEAGHKFSAVIFNQTEEFMNYLSETYGEEEMKKANAFKENICKLTFTYTPQINEWNGMKSIEFIINDYK